MRHLGLVAVLAIVMSACADATDETQRAVVVGPPTAPQAWVVVEAIQTECCYDEGSTGVLEITNRDGFRMAELSFANPVPLPDEQFVGRFANINSCVSICSFPSKRLFDFPKIKSAFAFLISSLEFL